jgi:predicted lipoprotein with Yx(FWY)xxD motif
MAARMGHEGTLTTAKAAGAMLAAAALSAGALFASTMSSSPPASAAGSSGTSLTITTAHVGKVGTVLATQAGLTLYRYSVDPAGKATCTGACAKVWPPVLLPKGVTHIKAPHGVKGLTAVRVHGGRLQVFFHGRALYRFVSDKKGEASGQGVENDWFAVLSNGKSSASPSASASASTSPTPTTGAGAGAGSGAGGSATTTTSPGATKTPASGTSTPPTTAPAAKSTPTTAPPTTTPPTTAPPTTTTPTTSPPPTTTAPPTGGTGF